MIYRYYHPVNNMFTRRTDSKMSRRVDKEELQKEMNPNKKHEDIAHLSFKNQN